MGKKKPSINLRKISKPLILTIAMILFFIPGCYYLTSHYSSPPLIYPDNSGDHLIYENGSYLGIIRIHANISANKEIISSGDTLRIKANISYESNDTKILHYYLWYVGVNQPWILTVVEIYLEPGKYQIIDKEITFISAGVYKHELRSYNDPAITPEFLNGSNFSVEGRLASVELDSIYYQKELNERIYGLAFIAVGLTIAGFVLTYTKKDN